MYSHVSFPNHSESIAVAKKLLQGESNGAQKHGLHPSRAFKCRCSRRLVWFSRAVLKLPAQHIFMVSGLLVSVDSKCWLSWSSTPTFFIDIVPKIAACSKCLVLNVTQLWHCSWMCVNTQRGADSVDANTDRGVVGSGQLFTLVPLHYITLMPIQTEGGVGLDNRRVVGYHPPMVTLLQFIQISTYVADFSRFNWCQYRQTEGCWVWTMWGWWATTLPWWHCSNFTRL